MSAEGLTISHVISFVWMNERLELEVFCLVLEIIDLIPTNITLPQYTFLLGGYSIIEITSLLVPLLLMCACLHA